MLSIVGEKTSERTPPATVYQTFDVRLRAVPTQSLRARSKCDIAPGAPGASLAAAPAGAADAGVARKPAAPTAATARTMVAVVVMLRRARCGNGASPGIGEVLPRMRAEPGPSAHRPVRRVSDPVAHSTGIVAHRDVHHRVGEALSTDGTITFRAAADQSRPPAVSPESF